MAKRIRLIMQKRGTALPDVVFEDGSRAPNRRMLIEILSGFTAGAAFGFLDQLYTTQPTTDKGREQFAAAQAFSATDFP